MEPSQCSRRLRALADRIATQNCPSASRTAASLGRMAEAIEKGEADQVVVLNGPFKPWNEESGSDIFEGEVWAVVQNDELGEMLLKDEDEDVKEEYRENGVLQVGDHTFHVRVDWHWEPPDPSVGWAGGGSIESWELLALDGMELTGKDEIAIHPYIDVAVRKSEDAWATEAARNLAEDNFDPPDPYDDYYDR